MNKLSNKKICQKFLRDFWITNVTTQRVVIKISDKMANIEKADFNQFLECAAPKCRQNIQKVCTTSQTKRRECFCTA